MWTDGEWQPRTARLIVLLAAAVAVFAPRCAAQDERGPLTLHLFFSPSCAHCHAIRDLVADLGSRHPELQTEEHNLAEPENIELMAEFYARYQVPEDKWRGTIAVFVGDRWWNDSDEIIAELERAVGTMTAASRAPGETSTGEAGDRLLRLFEGFGVLTVALAGLADGVNPCALAALVFLISYLSFAKRNAREILATGLLFAAGVFLAYLAVGIGVFRGLQLLSGFATVSKLLYPAMAAMTLVLTVYTLRDYLRARAGRLKEMSLTLPRGMQRLSHRTIRGLLGGPGFLAFAFVAGLAISLLELLCTGQVYVPTLMYVLSTETLRGRAFGLLVLYVSLFTMPVVALTLVAYRGVSSQKIAALARRHTATTKLALAVVFALLTVYLACFSIHLFT